MVLSADGLALPLSAHHRHLKMVWNRQQLVALTTCCELMLTTAGPLSSDLRGRRLVIFDGPSEPESVIGVNELKQALATVFRDSGDERPSHLYFTGSPASIRVWQSSMPEHRHILERYATHERVFTHMSDRTQMLAHLIRVGGFQTLVLVSPWQQMVLFSAYLLRRLGEMGLKGNKVKLVPVPYGDTTDRELGAKAFGEDGLYAEQWRQACQDRQALPEPGPYFPSELRDRLENQQR